jgi:hypothetical protein
MARLWSSLVRQEKLETGMDGADLEHRRALVFAGFPTTTTCADSEKKKGKERRGEELKMDGEGKSITLTVFFAYWSSDRPCVSKILALALSRSFLSIPSLRGMAPAKMATSMSLNATLGSSVAITSVQKK